MFSTFLQEILARQGLSWRAFAKLVGIHPSATDHLKAGTVKPPLDSVEHWSLLLRLSPEDRAKFVELARLEHCPPEIRAEFLKLKYGKR